MERHEVWAVIDVERADLADLLDTLTPEQWATPSLCAGWTVRDVAAHLTLSHIGVGAAVVGMVRAGGSFNRMVLDSARRHAGVPTTQLTAELRAMLGSRRHPPGTSYLDPLVDVLAHGQDITVPLGIDRAMPTDAAVAVAERVWSMGFPYRARRRLRGLHLRATDSDWERGEGTEVAGPIRAIVMLLTGRTAHTHELAGLPA